MSLVDVFAYHGVYDAETRPVRPWRLGSWRWATQGHVLVALADDGSEADETPEAKRKALRYLDDAPLGSCQIELAALRAFVGQAPPVDVPCDECEGTGRSNSGEVVECEHCGKDTRMPCDFCGGAGLADVEVRAGLVIGVPINRVLLAFGLSQVPADLTVTIGTLPTLSTDGGLAVVVVGDGWRVVLMRLLDKGQEMPAFDPAPPCVTGAPPP